MSQFQEHVFWFCSCVLFWKAKGILPTECHIWKICKTERNIEKYSSSSWEDFIWKTPKKTHQNRKVHYSLSLWGFAHQHSAVVSSPMSEGGEKEEKNRSSADKINKHSPPRKNSEWCSKITLGSTASALPRSAVVMEATLDGTFSLKHETIQSINGGSGSVC